MIRVTTPLFCLYQKGSPTKKTTTRQNERDKPRQKAHVAKMSVRERRHLRLSKYLILVRKVNTTPRIIFRKIN